MIVDMAFTLIIGPMKSGKSLELIARMQPYEFTDKKLLLVQPAANVRDSGIVSRSGLSKTAQKVTSLHDVLVDDYDVIGIDEVHMFEPQETALVQTWILAGKQIIASGLDLDYSATLIPIIGKLLALKPEKIIDRRSVCELCKRLSGRYSQIVHNGRVIRAGLPSVVPEDGTYAYRPVCRTCYFSDEIPTDSAA